jgi:WD40 repeat protein
MHKTLATRLTFAGVLLLTLTLAGRFVARAPCTSPSSEDPPPVSAETPTQPHTDRDGNALPERVIARLGTLRFRGVRECLAIAPKGDILATSGGSAGNQVALWDVATGREIRRFGEHATLRSIAFSPDGQRLVSSANENGCRVWDVETGKQLFTIPGTHGAFTGDGKLLVSADTIGATPEVHVCDAATGRLVRQWPLQDGAQSVADRAR